MNTPNGRRAFARLVLLAAAVLAAGVSAAAGAEGGARWEDDPVLATLLREAEGARPEVVQAWAAARADSARVPQARALPDPVFSAGLQNDGFDRLRIGEMETSYWSVGAAQTFPWLGKRSLRARAQALGAGQSGADLERARLTARADVERAYLDLLLVRDQLAVLARLAALWTQAEGLARARYESGSGAQSDILRTQLEKSRLQQRRWGLVAEERRRLAALDRAVGRPLDAPLATERSLGDLADPALPDSATALAEAEARSPELRRAALAEAQAGALTALARRDWLPDVTVSGGVMPRGADFKPMWQAGVSVPLPLWAAGRQAAAVRESRLRGEAAASGAEAVRRTLRQRLEERRALLAAQLESNRIYRTGLLVQSEAAATSAMAQYQVGRVPFASVLEALAGYLADLGGFHESVAAARRLDIAQRELSLDASPGGAFGGSGGTALSGASGGMPSGSAPSGSPAPAAAPPATSMSRM